LKRHLDEVTGAVEAGVPEALGLRSRPDGGGTDQLRFFAAKVRDLKASIALYSVSSDLDAAKIVKDMGVAHESRHCGYGWYRLKIRLGGILRSWRRCCKGRWPA